jgi:hypothetical protein
MTPAALYDPEDLPDLEAAVLLDHADVEGLPDTLRWRAERVAFWPVSDLHELLRRSRGRFDFADFPTRASVLREVARLVGGLTVAETARRAAFEVALLVAKRWRGAGYPTWGRDARGLPVPHVRGVRCDLRYAHRLSPSGKALFACPSCDGAPSTVPTPPSDHPCPGRSHGSTTFLADAIVAGVSYAPVGAGLPLPAGDLRACGRCWAVGDWRLVDRVGRVQVCPACHPLEPAPWPAPDAPAPRRC